jgi:hypothetical protein
MGVERTRETADREFIGKFSQILSIFISVIQGIEPRALLENGFRHKGNRNESHEILRTKNIKCKGPQV